jgi:hypothetical protein
VARSPAPDAFGAPRFDRWTLYEACVQSPADTIELLRRAHGASPRSLCEDFAGTAAIARAWAERIGPATAIDLDSEALARAGAGVATLLADVTDAARVAHAHADVVFAGNFSILYLRERPRLLAYLALARERVHRGGVFACDTYGGPAAFQLGTWGRERAFEGGLRVRSSWEHRAADASTGMVENALHFSVERAGERIAHLPDAFVYRWRLWSPPELADALREAGFASVGCYANIEAPVADPRELDGEFSVCLVARAD